MTIDAPYLYEKNLDILKKKHPRIWQALIDDSSEPEGEIFACSNGQPNLKVMTKQGKEAFLHDPDDPEKEAAEVLDLVPENASGACVLIGMGLGYIIDALLEHRRSIRHLAVFDLNMNAFKQALKVRDFTTVLADKRLILSFDPDPDVAKILEPADKALLLENVYRLQQVRAFQTDITAYQELETSIFEFTSGRNIAGNTDQRFGMRFIKNRLKMLPLLQSQGLLENLRDCFKGMPAVLVAGGPSLDKNIHLIEDLTQKAVILAVDTVLPVLQSHGIQPHFVSSIDPQAITFEKIADCTIDDRTCLIASPHATPEVPRHFPLENVFWTFSHKPIEKWINQMAGGKTTTPGAMTVAHVNLTAAIMMGCDPIILTGQDLAYSGYRDHARGVVLSNPEAAKKAFLENTPDAVMVTGIDGEKVPSSRPFIAMKNHFEAVIAANPGPRYINATEGGAHISGTEVLPLKTVMDTYCSTDIDTDTAFRAAGKNQDRPTAREIILSLERMLEKTKNLYQIIAKYDLVIHSTKKNLPKGNRAAAVRSAQALPGVVRKKITQAEALEKKMDQGGSMEIWEVLEEGVLADVRESERALHDAKSLIDGKPGAFVNSFITNLNRLIRLNAARKRILAFFQDELAQIIEVMKTETALKQAVENDPAAVQTRFDLADFYFDTHQYSRLSTLLTQLESLAPGHGLCHFYNGVLAAVHGRYDHRDKCFNAAEKNDPALASRIQAFNQMMGDIYFSLAYAFKKNNPHTLLTRKLVFKGLCHCIDHPVLVDELASMADSDHKQIRELLETGQISQADHLLTIWGNALNKTPGLTDHLSNDQIADLYHLHSIALFAEDKLEKALEKLETALNFSPENPAMFATAAEIFFKAEEYDNGIHYLNQAVALDSSHAVIWENLGDRLREKALFTDAVTAYEQALLAMPDRLGLYKKIGDCYRETGHLAAAKEAYKMITQNQKIEADPGKSPDPPR
jgi:thioredoxin-like negative regulator of GroEL